MKIKKATNWKISQKFLNLKKPKNEKFIIPKWILFCEEILKLNLSASLYEARQTSSKYITISYKNNKFKVRFSNHKPIKSRESRKDCDFFVGVNHNSVTNTKDALQAVLKWKESLENKGLI